MPPCTYMFGMWLFASTWKIWLTPPGVLRSLYHTLPEPTPETSRNERPWAPSDAAPPWRVKSSQLTVWTSHQVFLAMMNSTPVPLPPFQYAPDWMAFQHGELDAIVTTSPGDGLPPMT